MKDEECGPWIEHDGKGCPCIGAVVQSVERSGLMETHIAGGIGNGQGRQWDWCAWRMLGGHSSRNIIRYRIRKPRGLTILEEIAQNPERELGTV